MRSVEEIVQLYQRKGAAQYGSEAVSQLEHALQCATLATDEGAAPALVAAALLHDIGHLISARPHDIDEDLDDMHHVIAMSVLKRTFSDSVLRPIGLHVDAKRYLCFVEPGYRQTLSPASQHSLDLQGGVFGEEEARRFIEQPGARDAVRLRRWDDRAKVPRLSTPSLAHYVVGLRTVVLR